MPESSSSRSLRIFLCHSSTDKPAVRELYQHLRADGFAPWLDEEDLLPGQDWQREIPKAVRNSDVVIVCLSRGSINKAGYVQKEIKFALDVADEQPEDTIFLIPLTLEECDVPERLNRWQWVNLFSPNGYARLIRALQIRAASLGLSASPIQPPAEPVPQFTTGAPPAQSVSNVGGGVNLEGQQVSVGKDVVGRDKIVQANTYIEHATIIQSVPPIQDAKATAQPGRNINVQTWGGVEFIRIPAGRFLMGSKDDNRLADYGEKPQHTVEIPYDYWLARYPVTNEQFAKFIEDSAYTFTRKDELERRFIREKTWKLKANHPVVYVTWFDAMEYCKWLNTLIANDIGIIKAQLRLPTEAEWEKAARGEYGNEFPWGNEFDKDKCNSAGGTTPVALYSPQGDSPYGVADMVGNVWEWCHSIFEPYHYRANDGREQLDVPPDVEVYRVARGGAYPNRPVPVRCAWRNNLLPRGMGDHIGFRVVVAPRLS
jgi:formylglycine-generating enzyme required for sulfatase activity